MYPPVDTAFFRPNGSTPGSYFLIVSALVPYKRIDLAIDACRLAKVPLKIVGDGPERARLEQQAREGVEFLGTRSDEEVRDLYREARGLLLPGEEDFGIAPVESLACGRPVVGLARGGATETVEHGQTGVLVDELSAEAFAAGINQVTRTTFDSGYIRERALRFSLDRFHDDMRTSIETIVASDPDISW